MAAITTAAALVLSGCGFHGLYSATWLPGGPSLGNQSYSIYIVFNDVLDLVPNSNVKVNDVAVGKVTAVDLQGWKARVKVQVRGDVSLPANAQADVRQTSLLGEKFVELSQPPAPVAARLSNGDTIPVTSTQSAPEVEEVLGSLSLLLNGGGLEQIQTITTELNKALHGNEAAVRDLITNQLQAFVGQLDKQKDQITGALTSIAQLAATLNQDKKSLTDALDSFPQALKILADERPKFTTLLQSLANLGSVATRVIASTQTALTSSLQSLQPVLEQLTAAGSDLPNALGFLLTFPFPVGKTTQFVKSDYANLSLHLDISLNDNLCGLNVPGLCAIVNALSPQKTPAAASSSAAKTQSSTATPVLLPGLGG
ncbi:MAG: MCE family protein [Actinomycetota bacterium]|nr:MCE family protein [Actinomycetota bacterium]